MAAPTLVSSFPVDAATGVTVQGPYTLTFSEAIAPASVTPATVQLFRGDDNVPLRGKFSVSGAIVTFLPERVLAEDTLYKIKIIGSDAGIGLAVRAATGELLASSITIGFRTGEERFVSLSEITSRDDIERVGPIRESDPLAAVQPTGGALLVDEFVPAQYASKVSINATGLHVDFSQPLDPSTVTVTSFEVKQTPALGIEEYYGVVPSGMTDVQLLTQIAESSWPTIPPVGTLTVIDDIVYWQLDPAANFLHNTEVSVKITTEVATPGGATLNEQIEYFFTTEYCPLYIGPDLLRIELGGLSTLNDDTLCRIIHKNSIEAWELSNRGIPLKNPPFRIRQWVKCKSILDILGVLVLARDLREGQTKTLGDLTIRQQPADPTLGAKYSQAEKCIDDLALFDDEDQLATVAVKGSASGVERHDFRMRTWDYLLLQAEPAANLQGERWEKQRHSVNYAFAGKDVRFAQRFFVRAVPSKASI